MTDEQAMELGRRYLDAGGKWMPGMLTTRGLRVVTVNGPRATAVTACGNWNSYFQGIHELIPDFRDHESTGCLLHVVLERWGMYYVHIMWEDGEIVSVCVYSDDNFDWSNLLYASKGFGVEALIAALEAAP